MNEHTIAAREISREIRAQFRLHQISGRVSCIDHGAWSSVTVFLADPAPELLRAFRRFCDGLRHACSLEVRNVPFTIVEPVYSGALIAAAEKQIERLIGSCTSSEAMSRLVNEVLQTTDPAEVFWLSRSESGLAQGNQS